MDQDKRLSHWAKGIKPSPTLEVASKAKAMKANGQQVYGFGVGEPDFDTPSFIKEAAKEALNQGKTKYLPAAGLPELREALAKKYVSKNRIKGIQAENVIVSPGGKFSCYLTILATCGPGDEVIIPAPYWVSYPDMVRLSGANPVILFAGQQDGFKVSPQRLRQAITDKTKLLIFNSPSNPTGSVYTKEEIKAILEVCLEKKILIMSDEIYEYLIYGEAEHHSMASLQDDALHSVITVGGMSKSFSMTGWRLGVTIAPLDIADAIARIQSHTTSNATTFAQYGALEAFLNEAASQQAIQQMVSVFDKRRLKMLELIEGIEGIDCIAPQGAFYVFPKISHYGLSSKDFASRLLDEKKVALVPGIAFGADEYVRLSYATSDVVIENGLGRLKEFCSQF